MRGAVAKRIRRNVYGDMSQRSRKHYRASSRHNGTIVADPQRHAYQFANREYLRLTNRGERCSR